MLVGGSGVDVDGAGADGSEGRRVAVVLCRDSQRCYSAEGWGGLQEYGAWMHGEYAGDNQPITRPEDPADYSRDSDDELPDLRHAILITCPPIAVVPATGLVM